MPRETSPLKRLDLEKLSLDQIIEIVRSENALDLHLQPIMQINTNKVYGYEVLSRFGISEILNESTPWPLKDQVILNLLFEEISKFPKGRLFINCCLSNIELIAELLAKYKLKRKVVVELDFGNGIFEVNSTLEAISKLHQLENVEIAIDDIGRYDLAFPLYKQIKPSYIKVDICVSKGIARNTDQQKKLAELILLAKQIGTKIIIEGVETEEDAEFMKKKGLKYIQGFLYSKPKPYKEFK